MKDLATPRNVRLVVDTLAPLGDYLRERRLVTGYGFEQTPEGVVCRFKDCRFADTVHQIASEDMPCAPCPVFHLMQAALQKRNPSSSLCGYEFFAGSAPTCVFHLELSSVVDKRAAVEDK